jgi:hypothetical protein
MGSMPLETCRAFNERWNNTFYYKTASCWLFLLSHTAMHGSMNIKYITKLITPQSIVLKQRIKSAVVVEMEISQSSQNVTSCYQRPVQFNVFVLLLSHLLHLLRNTIKNQIDWPDHCIHVNLLFPSTYFYLYRAFYVFTSFTLYVIKLNISSYKQFVTIASHKFLKFLKHFTKFLNFQI